jgi:hypothetical protein
VEGPIGRIGKPIDNREYESVIEKNTRLYIEKKLLEDLPEGGGRLPVYMGDYGCLTLRVAS